MKISPSSLVSILLLLVLKIASAQPGILDPTFGIDGKISLHPDFTTDRAKDIALTNDGKILLLSYSAGGNYLLRLKAGGILDSSFGNQGKLQILQ